MTIKRFNELILENQYSGCDGNKYFDFGSLNRFYSGYENPLYMLLYKYKIEKLEYIDPEVYLHIVSKSMGLTYNETINDIVDVRKAKEYAKNMQNGDKFPIGFFTNNSSMQEGRHRALALIELGCKCMPVIEITNDVSIDEVEKTVHELKDLTREQVNQIYKDKGYIGITDLDWRELENYIKYRL